MLKLNEEIEKKYKYVHLISGDAKNFHKNLIENINLPENGLKPEEHLFVAVKKEAYDQLREYGNVVFFVGGDRLNAAKINFCSKYCDWLFIHNLSCKRTEVLKIKKAVRKKIIWRTWGSDAGIDVNYGNLLKRTLKKIFVLFYKKVIRDFYAIGIANTVDIIDMHERYGNVKMFRLSYVGKKANEFRQNFVPSPKTAGEPLNIMIGHSGFPNDNHIAVMREMEKYAGQNIRIYLVLSYGEKEYIENVKKFARETFSDKAVIIEQYMPYEEYLMLLSKMDVAVLDGVKSYALGNLAMLLPMERKIVLNRKGIIKKAFDQERLPYICTDEIKNMDFEQFLKPFNYSTEESTLRGGKYEEYINFWKQMFKELEDKSADK